MKKSTLQYLEKHYLDTHNSATVYKRLTLKTKKILLKNLYQRLYHQKSSFSNALKIHMLLMVDQEYISQLEHRGKNHSYKFNITGEGAFPNDSNRICLEMEHQLYRQYEKSLKKIRNTEIRKTLLFHKKQTGLVLEEMKFIDKYMI